METRRLVGSPPTGRFFATEAPLAETRPWFATLRASLERIDAWCKERDARFMLALLPRSYQYSAKEAPNNWEADQYAVLGPHSHAPFRYFAEIEAALAFPVRSLLPTFEQTTVFPTCFADDPHWTPAGHAVCAEALAEWLEPEISALVGDE